MAARLLQLILLVQAAAIGALALLTMLWWGSAPAWLALAGAAATVLALRLAISINNFAMAWRHRSMTPPPYQLPLLPSLRLFFDEFAASMSYSSWTMARARSGHRIFADSAHPPVLLLHGYGCNSGYWAHLLPLLDLAHISHARVDMEPILAAIDDYVPKVAQALELLRRESGQQRVVIVAHSMGGLVARALVRACGSAHIAHIITLGTPHHGTRLASFGPGRNALQMRRAGQGEAPESDWLRELAASESEAERALVTSIYSHHDNIVAPQTSSHLPGARNIEFGGIGHVALGRNRRILACVMELLLALPPSRMTYKV